MLALAAHTPSAAHHTRIMALPMHPSAFDSVLAIAERNAQLKMAERDVLIRAGVDMKLWTDLLLTAPQSSMAYMPPYTCPAELARTIDAGERYDGGKWLCGWSSLAAAVNAQTKSSCIIYSFGSNFEPSFELFFQGQVQHKCDVHVYDPTLFSRDTPRARDFSQMLQGHHIQLHDLGVAAPSKSKHGLRTRTIPELLDANGHAGSCVDVLKLDVEGFELAIIRETQWEHLCVGNLLVEVHGAHCRTCKSLDTSWKKPHLRPSTYAQLLALFAPLERAGLRLFSAEPTSVLAEYADAYELSFVNASWLRRVQALHWAANSTPGSGRSFSRPGAGFPHRHSLARARAPAR